MKQDDVFLGGEGNAWFRRNREALARKMRPDWPLSLIDLLDDRESIKNVIELGCANGWRLARLKETLSARLVGVDASEEAIADGSVRYPGVTLLHGALESIPVHEEFDLAIVHFVLHWVDRRSLARCIAEIDRVVKDGGLLIVGDFLPDAPQRRHYHHLPEQNIFTYKQDYAKIFGALGTYRELVRVTYDQDRPGLSIQSSDSGSRGMCAVLKKSLTGYYQEIR